MQGGVTSPPGQWGTFKILADKLGGPRQCSLCVYCRNWSQTSIFRFQGSLSLKQAPFFQRKEKHLGCWVTHVRTCPAGSRCFPKLCGALERSSSQRHCQMADGRGISSEGLGGDTHDRPGLPGWRWPDEGFRQVTQQLFSWEPRPAPLSDGSYSL